MEQDKLDDALNFYEIKWKAQRNFERNDEDDEPFEFLSESIINSKLINNNLSICDDRDEINTIYT